MGPLIYLTMAYAAFWIIAFVFIFSMVSRQRNLQRDLEQLEHLVEQARPE
jgi:CcmD family protein